MKTITYSLASTKCMDEGWTVRPASPSNVSEQEFQDPFVIEINPQQLVSLPYQMIWRWTLPTSLKKHLGLVGFVDWSVEL